MSIGGRVVCDATRDDYDDDQHDMMLGSIALSDLSCRLFIDAARATTGQANIRSLSGWVQAEMQRRSHATHTGDDSQRDK